MFIVGAEYQLGIFHIVCAITFRKAQQGLRCTGVCADQSSCVGRRGCIPSELQCM